MALRRTRTIAATTALAAGLTLAGALSAPASADTYGPPRVVRDGDAHALLTAYDPGDALGLAGDTHVIDLTFRGEFRRPLGLWVMSYTCGPHDRTKLPHEIGCADAGLWSETAGRGRANVVADDTLRLRGTTTAGRLDLTFTGSGTQPGWEPFVSREWRRAVGTTREVGRTVATDFLYATLVDGTFGGLDLYQDEAWVYQSGMRVRTATIRTGTGPAVPVPDLPPPGTQEGGWVTYGQAQATWLRRLPDAGPAGERDVEVGQVRYDVGDPSYPAYASRNVQRCEPGERAVLPDVDPPRRPCEIVDPGVGGSENATAALDVAAGTLRVELDVVPRPSPGPAVHVTFAWQGREPVGVHEVETTRYDSVATPQTRTREGVRWLRLGAEGTVAGEPVDRVSGLDFTVHRDRWQSSPPPE
jgi:hypothetical protein